MEEKIKVRLKPEIILKNLENADVTGSIIIKHFRACNQFNIKGFIEIQKNDNGVWFSKQFDIVLTENEFIFNMKKTLTECLKFVSDRTGISIVELKSNLRNREIVAARFMYFKYAKSFKYSLQSIANFVCIKTHANVLYGIRQVSIIPELEQMYEDLIV